MGGTDSGEYRGKENGGEIQSWKAVMRFRIQVNTVHIQNLIFHDQKIEKNSREIPLALQREQSAHSSMKFHNFIFCGPILHVLIRIHSTFEESEGKTLKKGEKETITAHPMGEGIVYKKR